MKLRVSQHGITAALLRKLAQSAQNCHDSVATLLEHTMKYFPPHETKPDVARSLCLQASELSGFRRHAEV